MFLTEPVELTPQGFASLGYPSQLISGKDDFFGGFDEHRGGDRDGVTAVGLNAPTGMHDCVPSLANLMGATKPAFVCAEAERGVTKLILRLFFNSSEKIGYSKVLCDGGIGI